MILNRYLGWSVVTYLLCLSGCASDPHGHGNLDAEIISEQDSGTSMGDPARGEALYDEFCGFCHGYDGEGYLADNANALSHQGFLTTATNEFITTAIVEGRPGTPMSPWGDQNAGPLDDEAVRDIVSHIRAWQTQPTLAVHDVVVEGTAMRGRAAYNAFCAGCHGGEGQGRSALSLNNPWFLNSASDGFIRYAIEHGRPEVGMPGYGEQVSAQTLDDLVVLIRSWAEPLDESAIESFEPNIENAVINEDGPNAMFTLREGRFAAADAVHNSMEMGEALIIIDARPRSDYLASHIEGAISIPFYEIGDYLDLLPRTFFIVTYCGCPHAVSGQAADALLEAGFPNVAILDEGYYFWADQGWPLASGAPE